MTDTIDGDPEHIATSRRSGFDTTQRDQDSGITEADTYGGATGALVKEQRSPQQLLRDLRSDQPMYVQWILRLPMGGPLRALYMEHVMAYDRDMTVYFDTNRYISNSDRLLVRKRFLSMIEQMNAYQAWLFVADSFRDAITTAAEIASWLIFAVVTCVIMWTKTPLPIKLAYLFLSALLVLMVVIVCLRGLGLAHLDNPWSKAAWLLAFVVALASTWLLLGAWCKLGVLEAVGILLLASAGTLIAATAIVYVRVHIRSLRVRAAIYLIGIGALSFVAMRIERPHWPLWLVRGTWSALWASLALTVAFAGILMLTYLFTSVVWDSKNRRYTIAELVQTLAWMGVSLKDEELPADARSVFSKEPPTLAEVGKVEALEYVANLMERYLPRQLRTHDPSGDRFIAERCRGMACATRRLKLELILKHTPSDQLASQLVPAIPPIVMGNWNKIAHVDQEEGPAPGRWARLLNIGREFIAAVAPLVVVLTLRAAVPSVPDAILAPALPITITWLLVSIITWIDPGKGERTSEVKTVLDMWRGG